MIDRAPLSVAAGNEAFIATEVGDDFLDQSMNGFGFWEWPHGMEPEGLLNWDLYPGKQKTLLAGRASRVKINVLYENLSYLPASLLCSSLTMLDWLRFVRSEMPYCPRWPVIPKSQSKPDLLLPELVLGLCNQSVARVEFEFVGVWFIGSECRVE